MKERDHAGTVKTHATLVMFCSRGSPAAFSSSPTGAPSYDTGTQSAIVNGIENRDFFFDVCWHPGFSLTAAEPPSEATSGDETAVSHFQSRRINVALPERIYVDRTIHAATTISDRLRRT
jgi:hypothetical protein